MSRRGCWHSRGGAAFVLSVGVMTLANHGVLAQDAYGPVEESEFPEAENDPVSATDPCDTEQHGDDVIVVCAPLDEQERYRDPLPPPVASDRVIFAGLNDPPCWVTKASMVCVRMGWAPEPAIMVDTTAFPDKMSEQEIAAIVAVEGERRRSEALTGERVPIDISEEADAD